MSSLAAFQRALHHTALATNRLEEERAQCLQTIHHMIAIMRDPSQKGIHAEIATVLDKASKLLRENKVKRNRLADINKFLKTSIRTRKQMKRHGKLSSAEQVSRS